MDANFADQELAKLAAAIAEPARARMLCCLLDGRARTGTELAVVADVAPSTASVHLNKLLEQKLVTVLAQGKYRYYQLAGAEAARALEALLNVAGIPRSRFVPTTPERLRKARTCYDHLAGEVAVALFAKFQQRQWISVSPSDDAGCELSAEGEQAMLDLGIDLPTVLKARRRFACTCLDWSERQYHLGGALGAALLKCFLSHAWLERDLDSRALSVTPKGKRVLQKRFELQI